MIYADSMVNPDRVEEFQRTVETQRRLARLIPLLGILAAVIVLNVSFNWLMPLLAHTEGLRLPDPVRFAAITLGVAGVVGVVVHHLLWRALDGWLAARAAEPGLLRPVRAFLDGYAPIAPGTTQAEVWDLLGLQAAGDEGFQTAAARISGAGAR